MLIKSLTVGMLIALMIIEIKLVARMLYLNMRDRNVVDFFDKTHTSDNKQSRCSIVYFNIISLVNNGF